jgi:hypothetical protein
MRWPVIVGVIASVVFAVIVWFLLEQKFETVESVPVIDEQKVVDPSPEITFQPVVRQPSPANENVAPSVEPIKPLVPPPQKGENSDIQVFKVVDDIAPQLSKWLVREDQVDKWTLLVDLLANGELLNKHRPVDFPMPPFKVGKDLQPDQSNYARLKPLLNVVMQIPPRRLANYYRHWQPVLENSYRELGKSGSFDARLDLAIDRILAVKPLDASPALNQTSVMYKYNDPVLEKSKPLDKLMWRLGEENMRQLQDYLRELKTYL